MIISNIGIVTISVILFFGCPILWNLNKAGRLKSLNFLSLIKTINISLKIQGIIGLSLIPLSIILNITDFKIGKLLGEATYTYLIVGIFMYLPALAFLNFIKLLIEGKLEKQKIDELDENFIKEIIAKLKERLERNLTTEELNAFALHRSGIGYEMILDYLSNKELSKAEIESYVQKLVEEDKKTTHNTAYEKIA